MRHIMLDLETLSSRNNAAIVAIGAVRFDLETFQLGEEFYKVVDPSSCQKLKLHIDARTVIWWMNQSEEAREIFSDRVKKDNIKNALAEFSYFVRESDPNPLIWGNGATFDNVIIRTAYEMCNFPIPWSHRQNVCYRTIRKMFPHERVEEGVLHNALQDAKNQAQTMIQIFRDLKGNFVA